MTILTESTKWQRKRSEFAQHRKDTATLTPDQQLNVRRALSKLVRKFGSFKALCEAMGMSIDGLMKARTPKRAQTPRLAIIVARVAECGVDEILNGTYRLPPIAKGHPLYVLADRVASTLEGLALHA